MTKKKPHEERTNRGRPPIITDELVRKLEMDFAMGLTDMEACAKEDIKPRTFYDYCAANEDFAQRKEQLKKMVGIKAKLNLIEAINKGDIDLSKWYAERKLEDFKPKQEISGEFKLEHKGNVDDMTTEERIEYIQNKLAGKAQ